MTQTNPIKKIHSVVEDEFTAFKALINSSLSSDVPLINTIGEYLLNSGGKRLRPLLVLLTAKALDYPAQGHIPLAVVIEFLHTASLLHDDVVDESSLRRGRITANENWGNAASVLVGDFLYSRAFQIMVELRDLRIFEVISTATRAIAEGEVMQLVASHNSNLNEDAYLNVIYHKTATLFEAASHCAALLSDAEPDLVSKCQNYGKHLGMAFQLIDDVLDYQGDAATMGKNVGDDIAEGKITLPLIHALRNSDPKTQCFIQAALKKKDRTKVPAICQIVESSGGLQYTTQLAKSELDNALICLEQLPSSPYRIAMENLAHFAANRTY